MRGTAASALLSPVLTWIISPSDNPRSRPHAKIPMATPSDKSSELKAFLFLTVVMAPVLAGAIIGTYGLMVWIYQMFMGPPTG
jgi:nitrate reductase NapE